MMKLKQRLFSVLALAAMTAMASGQSDVFTFLRDSCGVDGASSIWATGDVLAAGETRIMGRGEEIAVSYGRFHFAFVDDCPGANWAHPCRYVFISEDFTSYAVLHKRWPPRVLDRTTGERIQLLQQGEGAAALVFDEVKRSAYDYAKKLAEKKMSYGGGDKSKSHFVLFSGGTNPEYNGIRFWNDTAMVYSTLTLKYGVPKDNIHVYMSDGLSPGKDANLGDGWASLVDSPRDLDGDGMEDITGAATKSNFSACFASLKSRLTADDQLFVFITGHGDAIGTPGPDNFKCEVDCFSSDYELTYFTDKELASWTEGLACPVAFAIEPCYSGGFIDDLVATPQRVVATACNHYELSWGNNGKGRWMSTTGQTGSYNYWSAPFIAAFRGYRPCSYGDYGYPWSDQSYYSVDADSNGDGKVSFNEAYLYAYDNDTFRCTSLTHPAWCSFDYVGGENNWEHPQYGENPNGLGASFYLLKPSSVPELFSGGKETPFTGNVTYSGWVRTADNDLAGLLSVKAAKAAKDGKVKLTVTYTPLGGKKQNIRLADAAMPVAGTVATVLLPGLGTVRLTGDAIVGVDVNVQAGRDVLKSRNADEKSAASAFVAGKAGTWTFALGTDAGYAAFSVTVNNKGKGNLTGTLPDGTKVSVSSQGVIGDTELAIPFAFAKKGSLGLVFWVKAGGSAALSDISRLKLADGTGHTVDPVAPSMAHALSDGSHTFTSGGVSQAFTVAGAKWTVPRQNKRADVDPNPAGLKLKYTAKTGIVKGSFAIGSGASQKKYTVVGVVVGNRLYGSAYARNAGSVSATAQ